jgi:hypothetical protein
MVSHNGLSVWHRLSIAGFVLLCLALAGPARSEEPNTLTAQEKNEGWELLFDGRTTAGWRGYRSDRMPQSWRVENGSLLARRQSGESAGDIVTLNQYDNFELRPGQLG